MRWHNWLRTDTIFIENEQIEAISNRPPWVAAVLVVGMSDGSPESLQKDGRIRQARLPLPAGTEWQGLRLRAALEVKGALHPVRWACRQALEADGALRLRPMRGVSG